jgi:site-specific DNA-methyltransferase (adenine-specific)
VFAPAGGTVIDPFVGSGSTGIGALQENQKFIGIDQSEHYCEIARRRIADYLAEVPEDIFGNGLFEIT